MSLYSKKAKIDGLELGLVMRGTDNGQYMIVFERECATLEQIEAINWEHPNLEGDCILPAGYGFEVEGVTYSSSDKSYRVTVRVARQFLGDVTGYQEQIEDLRSRNEQIVGELLTLQGQLAGARDQLAEARDQLAEADETAISLYEKLMAEEAKAEGDGTGEAEAGEDMEAGAGEDEAGNI